MKKTTNYQLSQWDKTDRIVMEDFNGDNAKIDAALRSLQNAKADKTTTNSLQSQVDAKCSIVVGTYTGDGSTARDISLGFTPQAVLVMSRDAQVTASSNHYGGLALLNYPCLHPAMPKDFPFLEVITGGFRVYYRNSNAYTNIENQVYHFIAFQ